MVDNETLLTSMATTTLTFVASEAIERQSTYANFIHVRKFEAMRAAADTMST